MPDWVTCLSCGLKHTARPDGACPRCRQPIGASGADAADAAVPEAAREAPASTADAEPPLVMTYDVEAVHASAKAAGLVLIANGLLHLIATLVMGLAQGPTAFGGLISVVIDFVVGGYLVAGDERALTWAKIRVGLGLVILPFVQYAAGGFVLAAFQVAFSAGLLLLLVGSPGTARLALGVVACGLCLFLEVGGLLLVGIGTNPLARFVLSAQTEGPAIKTVEGREFRYRLQTTGDGWHLRKADLARKDNPLADRWIIHPQRDAHLLVIAERVGPTVRVDMDKFQNVVLGNARGVATNMTVLEQRPIDNRQGPGRLVHTRAKMRGQGMEFYYGLYAREPEIYQLVAFTFERNFKQVEPSLYEWVSSLETPGWEPPARFSTFERP